ncbi:MAG: hypothetical protein ACYCO9_22890 [Streptosporangiaceae bacterium]
MLALAGALAACALLGTGCSPVTGEHVVFQIASGFSNRATATTADLVDIGMPDLINQSGHAVTIRRVSLVSAPPSVHLRMVTGYLPIRGGEVLAFAIGNYVQHCRRVMRPYRLTSVINPPHQHSRWYLVISLNFSKPGHYYLRRVRIDYTTNGHQGWQYQNLNQTMIITLHNKKLKSFDGCL